jgi:hypothetical protein
MSDEIEMHSIQRPSSTLLGHTPDEADVRFAATPAVQVAPLAGGSRAKTGHSTGKW